MAANSRLDRKLIPAPGCAFGHFQNVAILVWGARPDGNTAPAATNFADALMGRYEMFSVIHVSNGAGFPTPEGRDAFVAAARKGQDRAACIGLLLPGAGIVANMVLAFVRGIRTLLRGNLHLIVARDVKTLVRELSPDHTARTGVSISMSELAMAIEEVRALASTESPRSLHTRP